MDSEGVSLPLMHKHLMMPWNDVRKGDCCGRFEAITDGYYCKSCDVFVHKKCGDKVPQSIEHPFHSHTLQLRNDLQPARSCDKCRRRIVDLFYHCDICDFDMDLLCVKYTPPEVIVNSKVHHHKLTLLKEPIEFTCDAKCEKRGYGFPYQCHECGLAFHVDCVWHSSEVHHPSEVNHSHHSFHTLKLVMGKLPEYSDGTCRLCGSKIDRRLFYHCSSCNFSLDMRCVLKPPPKVLLDSKAHEHPLTLLPRHRSFICNACGLEGNRSPYICVQCDFIIHQSCLDLPRLININRHDHRIARTSVLGVVNSVCGVCGQKVDWTCGGYSCKRCLGYVVHSKCATTSSVWNGKELEGVPEEEEDIEPYVVIDNNTIKHFCHKQHYLKLNVNGVQREDNKHCNACSGQIFLQSFYSCMDCDFILHKKCAQLPTRKWHVLRNERLTLVTSETNGFHCLGCYRVSNGFRYQDGNFVLDVRCGSIGEPFAHPSHPHPLFFIPSSPSHPHPLYFIPDGGKCKGCNEFKSFVLRCVEKDSEFLLGFECATLPQVVKHRVDDNPLSLCYGEKANGKYWCDICEKETNPETWFYTCKDHQASLHTKCVLGDLAGLMPRSTLKYWEVSVEVVLNNSVSRPVWDILVEVVLNNSVSRPFCRRCKSHCMYPIILKLFGTSDLYICSFQCMSAFGSLRRLLDRQSQQIK